MSAYRIDENRGFDFSTGNITVARGSEAIAIDSEVACLQLKGENPYSINQGIDYLGRVFLGTANVLPLKSLIRREILTRVAGAQTVDNFNARIDGDTIFYTLTINGVEQGEIAVPNMAG